jgi:hypothetical protein
MNNQSVLTLCILVAIEPSLPNARRFQSRKAAMPAILCFDEAMLVFMSHHVRYGKTGSVDRELNTRTVEIKASTYAGPCKACPRGNSGPLTPAPSNDGRSCKSSTVATNCGLWVTDVFRSPTLTVNCRQSERLDERVHAFAVFAPIVDVHEGRCSWQRLASDR